MNYDWPTPTKYTTTTDDRRRQVTKYFDCTISMSCIDNKQPESGQSGSIVFVFNKLGDVVTELGDDTAQLCTMPRGGWKLLIKKINYNKS